MDRMSLSIKNQWFDDKNRAYIYFSIEDIMELLNCGRNKAIKSMRELDDENDINKATADFVLEQPWLSLFFYPYKRDCSADYVEQTEYDSDSENIRE